MWGRRSRCRRCKADLIDDVAPPMEGRDEPTWVRLTGLPGLRCDGCARTYADPDAFVIEQGVKEALIAAYRDAGVRP